MSQELFSDPKKFQDYIRTWRESHRRDLPWRKTTDPYKIWISESMLAQTQVSRVINYYNVWMRKYPHVTSLAQISKKEVLKERSGLGYNNRALRILQAAQDIVEYQGDTGKSFPDNYQDLKKLPGVGDYTACAICAFAYNQDIAVIDTNIRRILIYHFGLAEDAHIREYKAKALEILPSGMARGWYNALMDYGALECTARKTGIRPLTRQSKFEGSRRQARARIIKQLATTNNTLYKQEVIKRFSQRHDIDDIITDLTNEGTILYDNGTQKLSIVDS